MVRRHPGAVMDLGCGSGRLFASFVAGGATRVVGIDGSRALLDRARSRVAGDPGLAHARDAGMIELALGDVRRVSRPDRFSLVVLSGVIGHVSGPEDAVRVLGVARRMCMAGAAVVIDTLGPGGLPPHDLPLSLDWERESGGRRFVRRSQITRNEVPEGLRVMYSTLTDVTEADGTISRLPASFRLWYPSSTALAALAAEAELEVDAVFGSHDLDPFDEDSMRCIVVARPAESAPGER